MSLILHPLAETLIKDGKRELSGEYIDVKLGGEKGRRPMPLQKYTLPDGRILVEKMQGQDKDGRVFLTLEENGAPVLGLSWTAQAMKDEATVDNWDGRSW
ncbi:MAG TPA: hypothetical protein VMX18_01030 [Candidatus Bipolaricaulota bacterium]|nr:hypothetical protein [Candidatus Bipolaricaulota bacterium]